MDAALSSRFYVHSLFVHGRSCNRPRRRMMPETPQKRQQDGARTRAPRTWTVQKCQGPRLKPRRSTTDEDRRTRSSACGGGSGGGGGDGMKCSSSIDSRGVRRKRTFPLDTSRARSCRGACCRSRGQSRSSTATVTAAAAALLLCVITTPAAQTASSAVAAKEALDVVTPSSAQAGQALSVEWEYTTDSSVSGTTGDLNPFEIELRTCEDGSSDCGGEDDCGSAYLTLCDGEWGCVDSDGSYDVIIPEDVEAGTYVVQVTNLGAAGWTSASFSSVSTAEGTVSACSGTFSVEASSSSASEGMPVLQATLPAKQLEVGQAFTAEWEYDDGDGDGAGSFEVNLYSCLDGACFNGSCGNFADGLCDSDGCYDPGPGDYDVRLPEDISPGTFKLQIKKIADTDTDGESDAVSSCTDSNFTVVAASSDSSSSNTASTPSPTEVLTPSPVEPTSGPAAAEEENTPAPVVPATTAPVTPSTPAPLALASPSPSPTSSTSTSSESDTPGTPPSPVPARVTCSPGTNVTYSYSEDSSTDLPLITIEHDSGDRDDGGCTSLTGLYEWLSSEPEDVPTDLLYPTDADGDYDDSGEITGYWLLRTSVDIQNGVMFEVMGTDVEGGDCDKLMLTSSSDYYIRLRGYGGHVYIEDTHITSWDEDASTYHVLTDEDGDEPRSYIGCVSEILEANQTCDGVAQKERGVCRMDIIGSELGYLGYAASESYGITWKVRGLCDDLSNAETLFESVRVYGDMMNSDIHHMWYGMYSYGHLGGVWTNNDMHDNHIYGFDPHDDSDYLTIKGNTCYNNGNHGIIASKRCDHLLVTDNISFDNLGSGIMLHMSCDDSIVRGNKLYSNYDAGLSLVETSRTLVTNNTFDDNKWGTRILVGSNDNVIENNTFAGNTQNDIMQYIGSSSDNATVAPYTGFNERNTYSMNTVNSSTEYTVDLEDSLETELSDNIFSGSGSFSFIRTNETSLANNTGAPANEEPYVESSCFTASSGVSPVC